MVVFTTDPTTSKPTFKNYWPGDVIVTSPAAEATAFVYDNPDDLFEVQTSGTLAQTVARSWKRHGLTQRVQQSTGDLKRKSLELL